MIAQPEAINTDVLVAGSGAAGLVAALVAAARGLRVTVLEAAPQLGGTTALGSGRVWIPANWTAENAGDSIAAAGTYLNQVFDTRYPEMIEALLESARAMAEFVMDHSRHRFAVCANYPDYHPTYAGATLGGRCFDMQPLPFSELQSGARNTLVPNGHIPITYDEWNRWRYPDRFDWDLLRDRQQRHIVTGGPALVAALADAVLERGGRILTETALTDLRFDDQGSVIGAEARTTHGEVAISARATVIAAGGFDADPELRRRHLPSGLSLSASTPKNRGIALHLADRYDFATDNMSQGWWMPMLQLSGETILGEPYPRALIRERGLPHQIIVNRAGQRFVDEAAPYNEFGKAVHAVDSSGGTPNRETWMIYDANFHEKYALPGIPRDAPLPGNAARADSLAELAARAGIDAEALAKTVETFNRFCRDGVDGDFHRGGNAYDRFYGDPDLPGNNTLGPLERAPFTAVPVYSASIGSKGGPITTPEGRVRHNDGHVVDGLYSVGNASAFWTGDGYPGPGATHTVGMTFAYRAALEIAESLSQ